MHESELGTPLYRRSEAVAMNEDHRRAITVAQCSVGVVRGSSVITGVQWVRFGAKLAGVWVLRVSSTERGWRGPVSGVERVPCLPATVAVPRACAGVHEATRRARERWAAWNGVLPWCASCRPPREVPTPQKTPARAGQRATDARKAPRTRVQLRTRGRGGEERAKGTVAA